MKLLFWSMLLSLAWGEQSTHHLQKQKRQLEEQQCIRHECTWTQWGSDISGTQNGENFGVAVSLSRSGYVLAIGAERHNYRGRVQVYYFDRNNGGWLQRGHDLLGEDEWFGTSVDLSANGNRLVVGDWEQPGSVKVFDWSGYEWEQVGSTLRGGPEVNYYYLFGYSVRISGNGKRIIVGNYSWGDRIQGQAKVYELIDGDWRQVGNDINGRTAGDQFGIAVDISGNGDIVAVGGPYNERNGVDAGHVRVYKLVGDTWRSVGSDIEGFEAGDALGFSLALSSDGMSLVAGARGGYGGRGDRKGYLQVYDFDTNDNEWSPVGEQAFGTDNDTEFGYVVAMSGGGSRVVGATPYFDGQYARVFDVTESGVFQNGDDIEGDFVFGAPFGRSVALDDTGETVAVGATQRRGVTSDRYPPGYVRVYRCQ